VVVDPAIESHYGTGYERSRPFPGGRPTLEYVRSVELLDRLLPAAHGPEWGNRRNATVIQGPLGRLARIPAFPVWQGALSLFGIVALVAFALALFGVGSLRWA
jgi:hypothetical protein